MKNQNKLKPTDPGEGWRFVTNGEQLERGDEWYSWIMGGWHKCYAYGLTPEAVPSIRFRRLTPQVEANSVIFEWIAKTNPNSYCAAFKRSREKKTGF